MCKFSSCWTSRSERLVIILCQLGVYPGTYQTIVHCEEEFVVGGQAVFQEQLSTNCMPAMSDLNVHVFIFSVFVA